MYVMMNMCWILQLLSVYGYMYMLHLIRSFTPAQIKKCALRYKIVKNSEF